VYIVRSVAPCVLIFTLLVAQVSAGPMSLLPPKLQETIVAREIGTALNKQLPIRLDAGTAYPTVDVLPGGPFVPKRLHVTAATLQQPLLPGDYVIATAAFCTQYSVHRPGAGVAYKLGPLQGREAEALSALIWRGTIKGVPIGQLQSVSWSFQSGLTYSQMPAAYQQTIDQLIPDFKGLLRDDFVQNIENIYQRAAQASPSVPPLDALLSKLGSAGELLLSAKRQREIILQNYTSDQIRNQRLFDGQAGVLEGVAAASGPWTASVPGVYERFRVVNGWQGTNDLEVRVVTPARERTMRRRAGLAGTGSASSGGPTLLQLFGMAVAPNSNPGESITGRTAIGYSIGAPTQALITAPILDQSDTELVRVYIWKWKSHPVPKYIGEPRVSFGHVLIQDSQGQVLSAFPKHGINSKHLNLSIRRTLIEEGQPAAGFIVTMPNPPAFHAAMRRFQSETLYSKWRLFPNGPGETNCVDAAFRVLKAGGVDLGAEPRALTPGALKAMLDSIARSGKASKLPEPPLLQF